MSVIERIFRAAVVTPALAVFDLPRRRRPRPDGNLNPMPYTAFDALQEGRATLWQRLGNARRAGKLSAGFLVRRGALYGWQAAREVVSPLRVTARLLRAVLETRVERALALVPEIVRPEVGTVHVVDCGAAGEYHPIWDHFGNAITIHMFEPEKKAFEQLTREYAQNPKVRIYETVLASGPGELTLNVFRWPRGSSIYRPNDSYVPDTFARRHYEVVNQVTFPAKPLSEVLRGVDVSFLKADVEGAELEIIRGAEALLPGCVGLELEIWFSRNVLAGAPTAAEVIAYCQAQGFTLALVDTPRHWHYLLPGRAYESKGWVGQTDTLFLRMPHDVVELVRSGAWPRGKLAVAASIYLVYRSYEFAFKLIELAVRAGVLKADDPVATRTLEAVRRLSGGDRLVTYSTLRRWLTRVEGTDPYSTLS
ncbi:MAG: FkbM family methyltransferase [Candidatus Rokubacteria bacterium]|nr:FkbM family methyltransferase [Candidatus Rokubacteria bacterium]